MKNSNKNNNSGMENTAKPEDQKDKTDISKPGVSINPKTSDQAKPGVSINPKTRDQAKPGVSINPKNN